MYQAPLSEGGERRLTTMRDTEDGFKISEVDLQMRGAGDLIGTAQSGLPRFRVADMEAITRLARSHGITLVVDNTFTTPLAYRPFEAGADIVIHSVTKLLAGHSDAMLGYVACRSDDHLAAIDLN